MKHYIIVFLFTIVFTSSLAQKTASGYYITQVNDTIKTEFKIRKGVFGQITNDFTKSIQVIDSANKTVEFTPNDIKEYGFTNEGINYLFMSKPTKNGTNKFLAPVFIGSKSSLYQYGIFTQGSGGAFSSSQVFYTFEKADGTFLFLKNILFLFLLLAYMMMAVVGNYIVDNYMSEDNCPVQQEYNAEVMDKNLNLTFKSISIDNVLRLLGDFIDYKVLRPNNFDWDYKIETNYINKTWKETFHDICKTNDLICWVKEKTIYVLPKSHPDAEKYMKYECLTN